MDRHRMQWKLGAILFDLTSQIRSSETPSFGSNATASCVLFPKTTPTSTAAIPIGRASSASISTTTTAIPTRSRPQNSFGWPASHGALSTLSQTKPTPGLSTTWTILPAPLPPTVSPTETLSPGTSTTMVTASQTASGSTSVCPSEASPTDASTNHSSPSTASRSRRTHQSQHRRKRRATIQRLR